MQNPGYDKGEQEMKIFTTPAYELSKGRGKKFHIRRGDRPNDALCGVRVYGSGAGKDPVNEKDMCKNCLKHLEAWEEVDKPALGHREESAWDQLIAAGVPKEALEVVTCDWDHIKVWESPSDTLSHAFTWTDSPQDVDFWHNIYLGLVDAESTRPKEAAICRGAYALGTACGACSRCDRELDELQKMPVEMHGDICSCPTCHSLPHKYTPEQWEVFKHLLPDPETLKGYRLEYREPRINEEYFKRKAWHKARLVTQKFLVRTPLIDYIEDDEITDELLVENGGRLPCEVRNCEEGPWSTTTLTMVAEHFWTLPVEGRAGWHHCRIKKSNLKVSADQ